MHLDAETRTPSLACGTELLVMAPISPGFVPTLDSITYASRAKALLRLLHAGRRGQHEARLLRVMSDAVERVGVIHSLRVTVVDDDRGGPGHVLLSVNFDGSYEAYVRVIWQKAARLLDLIFCNTVDYPTGWDHGRDEWSRWLRSVQVDTSFFYAPPGVSRQDLVFFRMFERRDRGTADGERQRTRIRIPDAERIAWNTGTERVDPIEPDERACVGALPTSELIRQSLQALAGIHRLSDHYRPGTADGRVLIRAAVELLPELKDMLHPAHEQSYGAAVNIVARQQFQRQLAWFKCGLQEPPPAVRQAPVLPPQPPTDLPRAQIQAGILRPLPGVEAGCLAMFAWDDAAAAAAFLEAARPTTDDAEIHPDAPVLNLALTPEGLRTCGLDDARLQWFAPEFTQGMATRAGLLGDVRTNHPRRWDLPRREPLPGADGGPAFVPMEQVHAVVQLRIAPSEQTRSNGSVRATIEQALQALVGAARGIVLLHVQWLQRQPQGAGFVDHFGFTDGQSQPEVVADPQTPRFPNRVLAGEVLIGHANAADREDDLWVNAEPERRRLLRNGSYIVVRKLSQNVALLNKMLDDFEQRSGVTRETALAKMMGRWPAAASGGQGGKPLIGHGPGGINDFNYDEDPQGERCPLGAHIRRANPRSRPLAEHEFPKTPPGARPPRIVRRSLPYGPGPDAEPDADRGLLFMAYCSSIAEQFEVIQRWLIGGNGSGGFSGSGCPFLGVAEVGRERSFRFEHQGKTWHLPVDGVDDLGVEPETLVRLRWGLYAFAPSETAREFLVETARAANGAGTEPQPWSAVDGLRRIERLRRIEAEAGADAATQAWKAALEDPESLRDHSAASIWAAVRDHFGGVLRVPHGVLVASPRLVDEVLADTQRRTTVGGYQRRLERAFGPIFLGLDATDANYARLSAVANREAMRLSQADGYAAAFEATRDRLRELVADAIAIDQSQELPRWELAVDSRALVEHVLAVLCERWFGLEDNAPWRRGGIDLGWRPGEPVPYPGHFTATSRATFQPLPSATAEALSEAHGRGLQRAMLEFLQQRGASLPTSTITRRIYDDLFPTSPEQAASTVNGVLMGFLPTTEGVLRRLLGEWTQDGTLMALKALAAPGFAEQFAAAQALIDTPLRRTMMRRPVPEQIWRTATQAYELGADATQRVAVKPGDKLVLGLVSATQAGLEKSTGGNVFPVFGGNRQAPQAPTHACPGYHASIGVLTGFVAALLDIGHDLRTGPTPGTLFYTGEFSPPSPPAEELELELFAERTAPGDLLGFGDSWFHNPAAVSGSSSLANEMQRRGWNVDGIRSFSEPARTLKKMADIEPGNGTVYSRLEQRVLQWEADGSPLPAAVLLGGGGNDVKDGLSAYWMCRSHGEGSPLDRMLKAKGSSPAIDTKALAAFLDDMVKYLTLICRRLAKAAGTESGQQVVPIVVHAYDFPYPDGRASSTLPGFCPSLSPTFIRKGFDAPSGSDPLADTKAIEVMRELIKEMNRRYAEAVGELAKEGLRVEFVKLAGTLDVEAGDPRRYRQNWSNELHPTRAGFARLAAVLDEAITRLVVSV